MRARNANTYSGYTRPAYSSEYKSEFRAQTQKNLEAFYQTYASKTIDLLSGHNGKKAQPSTMLPYNPVTGHVFTGINSFVLTQHMLDNDLSDARFCKFNQASKLGEKTHVMKGGNGVQILDPVEIKIPSPGTSDDKLEEQIMFADEQDAIFQGDEGKTIFFRPKSVFHASQINNAPDPEVFFEPIDWQNSDMVERLVEASAIKVAHGTKDAVYTVGTDTIHMPAKRVFDSPEAYTASLLRQWYSATGSKTREGRFEGPSRIGEGILNQAAEELRAEAFSLVASRTLGLPYKMNVDPTYQKCWDKQLVENPKHIVSQTTHATRLVNTVIEFVQGNQPQAAWFPDKSTWPQTSMATDLDAQLDDNEQSIEAQIHHIVKTLDTDFAFTKGDEGTLCLSCDKHMDKATEQAGEEDIVEAFGIREALQNAIDDLEINIEDHNGKVVLRVDLDNSQDLDSKPEY